MEEERGEGKKSEAKRVYFKNWPKRYKYSDVKNYSDPEQDEQQSAALVITQRTTKTKTKKKKNQIKGENTLCSKEQFNHFLNLSTIDILDQTNLFCEVCLAHCSMF